MLIAHNTISSTFNIGDAVGSLDTGPFGTTLGGDDSPCGVTSCGILGLWDALCRAVGLWVGMV